MKEEVVDITLVGKGAGQLIEAGEMLPVGLTKGETLELLRVDTIGIVGEAEAEKEAGEMIVGVGEGPEIDLPEGGGSEAGAEIGPVALLIGNHISWFLIVIIS